LSEANRIACLTRCKQLLMRYDDSAVSFIWFMDEMFTVEPPFTSQNDRDYVLVGTNKKRFIQPSCLLHTRSTFSKFVMVSVAVSKIGVTELMFVDSRVKVNGQYYRNVLLSQQMIPAIKQVAGNTFVFQQDSAPAHHAHSTIQLLQRETLDFTGPDLWPTNSPDLNPVDYKIWGVMQQRVYESRINSIDIWHGVQQHIIDLAVSQWRQRLTVCVCAHGRHFEHLL